MGVILGIDQGGTKTCAAVMDINGNVLGFCRTGGCYFPVDGFDNAMRFIFEAAEGALAAADTTLGGGDMIVAGVTGIDWEGDDIRVIGALTERFGSRNIIALNDCEIAYYGGSQKPAGAVICAGTGINAALFAPNGEKFIMGDYLKSSVQGASAIAKKAFEAVLDADLGVHAGTLLTELFLDFSGDRNVYGLLKRYITDERFSRDMITLVPQIIETAHEGDAAAMSVLASFADELCASFAAAMKKTGMLGLECDIVMAGSVLAGRGNCLASMLAEKLKMLAENANIINAEFEPVVGACILGLLKKGGSFEGQTAKNAQESAEKFRLLRR